MVWPGQSPSSHGSDEHLIGVFRQRETMVLVSYHRQSTVPEQQGDRRYLAAEETHGRQAQVAAAGKGGWPV
jgi:hypothetical protein